MSERAGGGAVDPLARVRPGSSGVDRRSWALGPVTTRGPPPIDRGSVRAVRTRSGGSNRRARNQTDRPVVVPQPGGGHARPHRRGGRGPGRSRRRRHRARGSGPHGRRRGRPVRHEHRDHRDRLDPQPVDPRDAARRDQPGPCRRRHRAERFRGRGQAGRGHRPPGARGLANPVAHPRGGGAARRPRGRARRVRLGAGQPPAAFRCHGRLRSVAHRQGQRERRARHDGLQPGDARRRRDRPGPGRGGAGARDLPDEPAAGPAGRRDRAGPRRRYRPPGGPSRSSRACGGCSPSARRSSTAT